MNTYKDVVLVPACRHGSKAGVTETYEGHQAPVTGIDTHKVQEGIDLSHLFLTSSFDWTVKLWNLKVRTIHLVGYFFKNFLKEHIYFLVFALIVWLAWVNILQSTIY